MTDAGLVNLEGLTRLQYLSLRDTDVTDRGLMYLEALRQLDILMLNNTDVTVQGLKKFRKASPTCYVTWWPKETGEIGTGWPRAVAP